MSIQIRVAALVMSAILAGAASAQTAVEWKISEGGNGHWYQFIAISGTSWTASRVFAESMGGHLATTASEHEWNFVRPLLAVSQNPNQVWLGAYRSQSESRDWRWIDDNPLTYSAWIPCAPNNTNTYCCLASSSNCGAQLGWDDLMDFEDAQYMAGFLVEWSADCNADGIVDHGQILRGELDDDNSNGIPDVCETSVTGVIPPSVPSQGGATVTIKGANFPDHPTVLIGGVAATDVVRLSATRITATSPALLPGMASISVNGFTLPEALYIRPECGSDLDQNGVVDAGDISIILLDFGPCYEPPAALAGPAPTPLLADEPAQKPTQR